MGGGLYRRWCFHSDALLEVPRLGWWPADLALVGLGGGRRGCGPVGGVPGGRGDRGSIGLAE